MTQRTGQIPLGTYTGTDEGTPSYPYTNSKKFNRYQRVQRWHTGALVLVQMAQGKCRYRGGHLHIPIYEKHEYQRVRRGQIRGTKENGGYPWVPRYRYPFRYHLYTCHMTQRTWQVPLGTDIQVLM